MSEETKAIRSSDLIAMGLCPSVHNAVRIPGEDKAARLSKSRASVQWPVQSNAIRLQMIKEGLCPECGGELDTGFECNDCSFDAIEEARKIAPGTPCA
jgi:hypothetical protein